MTAHFTAGFPHSDIPGSKPACGSPRLIAACHVLLRLPTPRHPPCALSSLTLPDCNDFPLPLALLCGYPVRNCWCACAENYSGVYYAPERMRLLCKPHLSRNPAWPRKPTARPPREAPGTQDGPGFFAQLLPLVHRARNDSLEYPGDCQPFFCSFFPRVFRSPGAPSGKPLPQPPLGHRREIIPAQESKSRGKMPIFWIGAHFDSATDAS